MIPPHCFSSIFERTLGFSLFFVLHLRQYILGRRLGFGVWLSLIFFPICFKLKYTRSSSFGYIINNVIAFGYNAFPVFLYCCPVNGCQVQQCHITRSELTETFTFFQPLVKDVMQVSHLCSRVLQISRFSTPTHRSHLNGFCLKNKYDKCCLAECLLAVEIALVFGGFPTFKVL